jgi:hypothetical protein
MQEYASKFLKLEISSLLDYEKLKMDLDRINKRVSPSRKAGLSPSPNRSPSPRKSPTRSPKRNNIVPNKEGRIINNVTDPE